MARIQVLAIGETVTGKSRSGNDYSRRTFQVFDPIQQVAGNITVFGTEEELDAYKANGVYETVTELTAGDRGRLDMRIVKLEPVKQQVQAPTKQ